MIAISDSQDLRRILALPVRELEPPTLPLEDLGGTLRPVQEEALRELLTYRGALVSARVGAGKTLISLLAGTVIGAKRPLLLVPAKLKAKTELEAKGYAAKGWKITMPYVMSYELLGRSQSAVVLEEMQPDLVVLDEAHRVANAHSAVTRRVNRYLSANPSIPVLAMSGTLTKRQIRDFAHVARWCCKDLNPAPTKYQEIELWSLALGAKVDAWARPKLGALEVFTAGAEPTYEVARKRYGERIWATPSCIQTTDGLTGVGLEISKSPLTMGHEARKALAEMRRTWVTPGGDEITTAVELYRHSRELACGFYYRWQSAPPREWIEARRDYFKWVRETLSNSRRYDSPFQLEMALQKGDISCDHYPAWASIRGIYEPTSVPVWIDDSLVRNVASRCDEPYLIWVEHDAMGRRLAELGIHYYGPRGVCTKTGMAVESAEPSKAIAVSVRANGEGRNLQAWHKNLVLCPSQMGAEWEQMLGRTHRDGQEADTVEVEIFCATELHEEALRQAKRDARYIHATTGQEQKLLTATWTFDTET